MTSPQHAVTVFATSGFAQVELFAKSDGDFMAMFTGAGSAPQFFVGAVGVPAGPEQELSQTDLCRS